MTDKEMKTLMTSALIVGSILGGFMGWSIKDLMTFDPPPHRIFQCAEGKVYSRLPHETFWIKEGGSCISIDKD